jgi:hypothetical protein
MSAPKDELHQWYIHVCTLTIIVCTVMYLYRRYLLWRPHCAGCPVSLHPGPAAPKPGQQREGTLLVSEERIKNVWERLADRFAIVVADTSMITLSTAYAAHFHDIYIDGKENANMAGDHMTMLMLTLPFMVHDLIAPTVH